MCLIANSDGIILAVCLNYHSDFISIMLTFLQCTVCFDESSSFGEQSNTKKSDIPRFITAFSVIFFGLIFSMQAATIDMQVVSWQKQSCMNAAGAAVLNGIVLPLVDIFLQSTNFLHTLEGFA